MIWVKARTTRQGKFNYENLLRWILFFLLIFLLNNLFLSTKSIQAESTGSTRPSAPSVPLVPQTPAPGQTDSAIDQNTPIENLLPDPILRDIVAEKIGKPIELITMADCLQADITITPDQFPRITSTLGLENFKSIRIEALADKNNAALWHNNTDSFWTKWFGTAKDFQSKTTLVLSHDLRLIFPDGFQFDSLKKFKAVEIAPATIWRSDAALHLNPDNYRHFQISTANLDIPSLDQNWSSTSRLTGFTNPNISYTAKPSDDGTQIDFTLNNPDSVSYKDLSDQNYAFRESGSSYQGGVSLPIQIDGFTGPFSLLFNLSFDSQSSAAAPVTVQYVDARGQSISQSSLIQGQIGDSYTAVRKNIDGYYFQEVRGQTSGQLSQQGQLVVFIYAKINSSTAASSRPDPASKQSGSVAASEKNKSSSAAASSALQSSQLTLGNTTSVSSTEPTLLLTNQHKKGQLSIVGQIFQTILETAAVIVAVFATIYVYTKIKKKRE
ncbi:MucBP domain-containing protein [Oenococcus sp.]|uniref:MucBP domain-containing protein n=1 Tax=Oenococcus sp. TaxID=1979414 RepID=UPI0039ED89EB